MSTHDVAEAEHKLSDLIDQALKGEAVVITRDGRPVAEIRPVAAAKPASSPRRMPTKEDLDWLASVRLKLPVGVDAQTILRQIRDGN